MAVGQGCRFISKPEAKQSKANFAFGLFWPPENPGKAKQSRFCKIQNPKQSKAKQSKAKQSQKWENFEKILKKKLKSSDEKRLDYTVSESLPKAN